jgi:hypothetical protein
VRSSECGKEQASEALIGDRPRQRQDRAAMVGMPGSQAIIELVQFVPPGDEGGIQQLPANTLAIRHIVFTVEGSDAVVARLKWKVATLSLRV